MIKGNKILLCAITVQDIEQLREWRNKPEIKMYTREYREITPLMQEKWFQKINEDNTQINFLIREYSANSPIGHCGLYKINYIDRTAEFSIYIGNPSSIGKGYAQESLELLLQYGFETVNLNKIWGEVYSNNLRALKLFKKVGFVEEGLLKQHVFRNGQFLDSYLVGILKKDWLANKK